MISLSSMFWDKQSEEHKNEYINLLKIMGSLSNLFSDSTSPYLYYRGHENLFCEAFKAKNLSRGDVSYDAVKDGVGIGLKTFLNNNGLTFQKVAEFNNDSDIIRELDNEYEIAHKVATLRNKRLKTTQNMTDTHASVYHLVTREPGKMNIVESPMYLIDIDSIRLNKKQAKNTIKFKDKYNEYSFSLSKNTLLQRFDTREEKMIKQFSVEMFENPFNLLKSLQDNIVYSETEKPEEENYIILPLYSVKYKDVRPGSGLNQWNARGRERHPDEVYIPIPAWIHDVFDEFFDYAKNRKVRGESAKNSPSFFVELPNGKVMTCKVAQAGGKALMSDPNKDLGHWILRDVLDIPQNTLVTMEMLKEIGIDSVKLTKMKEDFYLLDFVEAGTYSEFEENNKI